MREVTLRCWHRRIGGPLALFILLQAVTGLLLSIERLFGSDNNLRHMVIETGNSTLLHVFDSLTRGLHYGGPQLWGNLYRIALSVGLIWMTVSGLTIYLRVRSRQNNQGAN